MNCRKRLISLIISLVLAVSCVNISISFAAYADADNDEIKENVTMLAALNVIEYDRFEDYDHDRAMTRQEFAGVIGRMFALGEAEGESVFGDVPFGSKNIGHINAQHGMGIITGDENGNFNPYDAVKYNEAIIWIMRAAGFEDYMKETNDSNGFKLANKYGISAGISYSADKELTRAEATYIIRNTLDLPILIQNGVIVEQSGETLASMELSDNRTVLTECLKLSKIKGVVSADENSRLDNSLPAPCGRGHIVIEGFDVEYDGGKDVLGMCVNAYLREDNGVYSVVYLSEYGENETISADYRNFSYSNGVFSYWNDNDDKEKKEKLLTGTSVIYNRKFIGKVGTSYISDEDFMLKSGNALLIDNDGDGEIEAVKLTEYKTVYISDIEYDKRTVIDYFTNEAISFNDVNVDYSFTFSNGLEGAFDKIKAKNVLSVMESRDKEVCKVIVSDKTVRGIIYAIKDDELTIEKTDYPISEYRAGLVASGNRFIEEFKYGANCIFYVDHEGEIVTYESVMSDNYGYVIGLTEGDYFGGNVKIKLYTANGKFEIYEFAENVTVSAGDLKTKYKREDAVKLLNQFEVIRFELDKNNKIKLIEQAVVRSESEEYLTKNMEKRSMEYHVGVLGAQYCVNNESVVFNVPDPDINADAATDAAYYSVGNRFSAGSTYTVDVYGMDVYRTAKIVINYQKSPGGGLALGYSSQLVVDERCEELIDDEVKQVLKGYTDKIEKRCYIEDGSLTEDTSNTNAAQWVIGSFGINDLSFGDVISYSLNSLGGINKFRVLHRASETAEAAEKWSNTWLTLTALSQRADLYTAYGQVDVVSERQFVYKLNNNVSKVAPFNSLTQFYIVDMKIKKIESVTKDAVRPGDKVFITINYDKLNSVYIYRW